jgi:uncharacterized membrane protein
MNEEILDRNLDDDVFRMQRYKHNQKWAKRWSWISVIILFLFVFLSGILIPIFNSKTESAIEFIGLTGMMIIVFLVLLTISNICSLYFRWRGFSQLVYRSEQDYFNLILSIVFLIAPFVLMLIFFAF